MQTKVGTFDYVAAVVKWSVMVNHPQLATNQDGNIIVPIYNGVSFYPYMAQTALKGSLM